MIRKSILLAALALPVLAVQAQDKNTKSKKTTITIIKEEDGKTTRIDTTFTDSDDVTIEAFFKKNGVKRGTPAPPVPPVPPVPGAPAPPPLPGDESSFNFHFSMPEFNSSFEFDLDKEMKDLKESLQDLKIDIKTNINEEELDKMQKELEKEMEQLKKEIKKHNHQKRELNRKKTGTISNDQNNNIGYIYKFNSTTNFPTTVCAGISNEPIVITSTNSDKHYTYVSCDKSIETKKKSKFRTVMNKIIERILD